MIEWVLTCSLASAFLCVMSVPKQHIYGGSAACSASGSVIDGLRRSDGFNSFRFSTVQGGRRVSASNTPRGPSFTMFDRSLTGYESPARQVNMGLITRGPGHFCSHVVVDGYSFHVLIPVSEMGRLDFSDVPELQNYVFQELASSQKRFRLVDKAIAKLHKFMRSYAYTADPQRIIDAQYLFFELMYFADPGHYDQIAYSGFVELVERILADVVYSYGLKLGLDINPFLLSGRDLACIPHCELSANQMRRIFSILREREDNIVLQSGGDKPVRLARRAVREEKRRAADKEKRKLQKKLTASAENRRFQDSVRRKARTEKNKIRLQVGGLVRSMAVTATGMGDAIAFLGSDETQKNFQILTESVKRFVDANCTDDAIKRQDLFMQSVTTASQFLGDETTIKNYDGLCDSMAGINDKANSHVQELSSITDIFTNLYKELVGKTHRNIAIVLLAAYLWWVSQDIESQIIRGLVIAAASLAFGSAWDAISVFFRPGDAVPSEVRNQSAFDSVYDALPKLIGTTLVSTMIGAEKNTRARSLTTAIVDGLGKAPRAFGGLDNLFEYVLQCIKDAINVIRGWCNLPHVKWASKWGAKFDTCIRKIQEMEICHLRAPNEDIPKRFADMTCAMLNIHELLVMYVDDPKALQVLRAAQRRLDMIMGPMKMIMGAGKGFRPQPACVVFYGEPGTGKTMNVQVFVATVLKMAGILPPAATADDAGASIFCKPFNSEYMDGYYGQSCYLIDDGCAKKPTPQEMSNALTDILTYCNSFTAVCNMATCESKGAFPFTSPLVLMTTNMSCLTEVGADAILLKGEAFKRRVDIHYEICVKREFRLGNTVKLDYQKFLAEKAKCVGPDLVSLYPWHIWECYERDFGQPPAGPDARGGKPFLHIIKETIQLLKQRAVDHRANIDVLNELMNAPMPDLDALDVRSAEIHADNQIDAILEDIEDHVCITAPAPPPPPRIGLQAGTDYFSYFMGSREQTEIQPYPEIGDVPPDLSEEDQRLWNELLGVVNNPSPEPVLSEEEIRRLAGIAPRRTPANRRSLQYVYKPMFGGYFKIATSQPEGPHTFVPGSLPEAEISLPAMEHYRRCHLSDWDDPLPFWLHDLLAADGLIPPRKLSWVDQTTGTIQFCKDYTLDHICGFWRAINGEWRRWHKAHVAFLVAVSVLLTSLAVASSYLVVKFVMFMASMACSAWRYVRNLIWPPKAPDPVEDPVVLSQSNAPRVVRKMEMGIQKQGIGEAQTPLWYLSYQNSFKVSVWPEPHVALILGQITFLRGNDFVMPRHFVVDLERKIRDGVITLSTPLKFRSASGVTPPVESTVGHFLAFPRVECPDRDLAFATFTNGNQLRRDIIHFFLENENQLLKVNGQQTRVDTCRMSKDGELLEFHRQMTYVSPSSVYSQQPKLIGGTSHSSWLRYTAETEVGDCGAMVSLFDHSGFANKCLLGLHIGREDRTSNGYGTSLSQDLIRTKLSELHTRSPHVEVEELNHRETVLQGGLDDLIEMVECDTLPFSTFEHEGKTGWGSFEANAQTDTPIHNPLNTSLVITQIGRDRIFDDDLYGHYGKRPPDLAIMKLGPWREGEIWRLPMVEALTPFASGVRTINTLHWDLSMSIAMQRFNAATINIRGTVLTYEQAVTGDPALGLKSIPRATSLGYPLCTQYRSKKDIFGSAEEFVLDSEEALRLKRDVLALEQLCRDGKRPYFVCRGFLKDEIRKKGKTTRYIAGVDLRYYILCRMYFGAYVSAHMSKFRESGVCVGINPYKDWHALQEWVTRPGGKCWDGDFKGFDSSEQPGMLWGCLYAINDWYRQRGSTPLEDQIRHILFLDLVNSRHLVSPYGSADKIIVWQKSLPSGHFLTSTVNSMLSMACIVSGFVAKTEMLDFWDQAAAATCGDDNLVGASDLVVDKFNQITLASHLLEAYGMTYTSGNKDSELVPYMDISQVTFLQRSFREKNDRVVCPIRPESFLTNMYYTKKGDRKYQTEVILMGLENALSELSMHTEDFWDRVAPKIVDLMKQYGTAPKFNVSNSEQYLTLTLGRKDPGWF